MQNKRIEQELYNQILLNMPIICCDLLIFLRGQYLLIRRNQEPCKDQLYFPGGRLLKNETLENACIRIAREETGLECSVRKFLGVYETDFKTGPNGIPVHTINMTYFLHALSSDVRLDSTSSAYYWISQNNSPYDLDPKLVEFVEQVFVDH